MAPFLAILARQAGPIIDDQAPETWNWRKVAKDEDLIIESWSQGYVVGALMLMGFITIANMRRKVMLHKLIFLEQLMALTHGTFCFMDFEGYGWYLSSTAALLYLSYILHNVVSWMKVKPFFHGKSTIFEPGFVKWTTRIYIFSLACTVPPVIFQITDNFRFFSGYGGWYTEVRPYEPLMRDPWWVFCCGVLFYVISKSYGMGIFQIIRRSPRFGILFVSIILALMFTALDIVASLHPFIGSTDGINPFWKLALVFKCLTDAILLDDFKTELKRLGLRRMKRDEHRRESHALVLDDECLIDSDDEANAHYSNGTANGHMNGHVHRPSVSNHNRNKNGNMEESEQVEFMQALDTHPSNLSSDRESRRSSSHRHQVGRGGTPATRLPKLFAAIKPGRRSKKSADEEAAQSDSIFAESGNGGFGMTPKNKKQKNKPHDRDDADIAPDEVMCEDDALAQARREQQRTIAELTARKNSAAAMKKASVSTRSKEPRESSASNNSSSTSSGSNDQPANSDTLPEDSQLRELSPPRSTGTAIDMGSVSTNSIMAKRSTTAAHRGSISSSQNTADLIRQHVRQQQEKKSASPDFWNGLDDLDENRPSKQHRA